MRTIILALLLLAGQAWGAFTDGLTANSRIAFVGDSWTSITEFPKTVGGTNYATWDTSGYYCQSADWAWRLCADVGRRHYRVFATGGAQVRYNPSGIWSYYDDVAAYDPDLVFLLGGINDAADAGSFTQAHQIAGQVTDTLQALIDRFQDDGAKVCILELHPCGNYNHYKADQGIWLTWNCYKESTRVEINSWINQLTPSDNLLIHRDRWINDTLGTFSGCTLDSVVIKSQYDNDQIHQNQTGNFARADSIRIYS